MEGQVDHYRQLHGRDDRSKVVVVGHSASESLRNESEEEIIRILRGAISLSGAPDYSENLASEIDRVDRLVRRC